MVLCKYVSKFEESGKALRKGVQVEMEDKEDQVETEGRGGAGQEEMGVRWNGGASQRDKQHLMEVLQQQRSWDWIMEGEGKCRPGGGLHVEWLAF